MATEFAVYEEWSVSPVRKTGYTGQFGESAFDYEKGELLRSKRMSEPSVKMFNMHSYQTNTRWYLPEATEVTADATADAGKKAKAKKTA